MKQRIRESILQIRKSHRNAEDDSLKIISKIKSVPEINGKSTFMFYYPHKNEVNLLPLLTEYLSSGKTVVLPRVEKDDIIPVKVEDLSSLQKGSFGIPEPQGEGFPKEKIDVVFVPAIAFDRKGHRLGYGKGYYDRFLDGFKGLKVGVAFDFQIVDQIPAEKHDVPVDLVITPTQVINTKEESEND